MKISIQKREKISEQILAYLYSISPRPSFTSHIAEELARDEEFIKGVKAGIELYAWWKDGIQYVGSCGTTLKDATSEVDKEFGIK